MLHQRSATVDTGRMDNYVELARALLAEDLLAEDLPELSDDLLDLYVLLVLCRGETTTAEDVHDAWAVWRSRGDPEHRSLVPFDRLEPAVQELDEPYVDAVHRAAALLSSGQPA
jgi:hypothetical protein